MATGRVKVEKIGGKSTATGCFSKYPLKFILPRKVGPVGTDAVWIYSITYGGGIVSGDTISCEFTIGNGCIAVLTTQASTKVYKAMGSKCSEQSLEARIGRGALFVVIPDPVTCFSTARYFQKQIFRMASDSNLVVVDWITSGRHANGEKWDFELYKSINNVYLDGEDDDQPLFLDTVLLEKGNIRSIAERMQDYQTIAMVIIFGTKLKEIQNRVQDSVKKIMSEQLHISSAIWRRRTESSSRPGLAKPEFIASCSTFGPEGKGMVIRIASESTESVYDFLRRQLAGIEPLIGQSPYP
ncbi:PREDICTED: urease accessory protein D isoform X2 [Tarenaya hassleriana]|uniref:urease accessory protein D isoform X2 n=1 Tax=Tarenaya hassleriana TaxID=28532 RepID=UPI00053C8E3D|nr:PREDICTED: urease accessory protein D isoform X2 [Tarenaya hassleriana]